MSNNHDTKFVYRLLCRRRVLLRALKKKEDAEQRKELEQIEEAVRSALGFKRKPSVETEGDKPKPTAYEKD